MIVVVPAAKPVTRPEPDPMVATATALLLHNPNGVGSDNVVVRPRHTLFEPVTDAGNGFTVTALVVIQPVGNV